MNGTQSDLIPICTVFQSDRIPIRPESNLTGFQSDPWFFGRLTRDNRNCILIHHHKCLLTKRFGCQIEFKDPDDIIQIRNFIVVVECLAFTVDFRMENVKRKVPRPEDTGIGHCNWLLYLCYTAFFLGFLIFILLYTYMLYIYFVIYIFIYIYVHKTVFTGNTPSQKNSAYLQLLQQKTCSKNKWITKAVKTYKIILDTVPLMSLIAFLDGFMLYMYY